MMHVNTALTKITPTESCRMTSLSNAFISIAPRKPIAA
jgi:hypothetical protein